MRLSICIATYNRAEVIGEPRASIIRQLRADGIGIVYISHRMEEVLALSDRITIMRDGGYVGDLLRAEATHDKIVAMMVGRDLSGQYFPPRGDRKAGEAVFVAENVDTFEGSISSACETFETPRFLR